MTLYVCQLFRSDPCAAKRFDDYLSLSIDTWCGVTNFAKTVIVYRGTADYGSNCVTVSHCIVEPFQHDNTHTAAEYGPICLRVEGATMPVWRDDAPLAVTVAGQSRYVYGDASGQRH